MKATKTRGEIYIKTLRSRRIVMIFDDRSDAEHYVKAKGFLLHHKTRNTARECWFICD